MRSSVASVNIGPFDYQPFMKSGSQTHSEAIVSNGDHATDQVIPLKVTAEPPTREEYLSATKTLSRRDRVGITGEAAATGGGVAAGAAAASAIAGAAGATTILGSTTLGSVLGGVFVATTPIGWVIGCAALAGLAGYVIAKLARSGGRHDEKRKRLIKSIERKIGTAVLRQSSPVTPDTIELLRQKLQRCVTVGKLDPTSSDRMLSLVDNNKLPLRIAMKRADDLLEEAQNSEE